MKKKLRIQQVRRKLRTLDNAMYDLFLDKVGHANSSVPFSVSKLLDLNKQIQAAHKRLK
jgi:hypothetical protein